MASSFPRKPAAASLLPFQNPREPIRVAIVEDDENDCLMMRRRLEQSQEFVCAGVYGSAKDALEGIPKVRPQVVLMDIRLPGMSGIECAWRLKLVLPGVAVIFVTGLFDSVTMTAAFKAGGDGYLAKPFSIAQLLVALRSAILQRKEKRPKRKNASARKTLSLTQREKAVMDGMAAGLLYKEMAEQLKCSHAVIKKLQHSAFHKLGVTKNTEAVRRWLGRDSHEAE
jgi:DNA-binding NarL/FixJ family response regulator